MSDLTDFLLARILEDEEVAREASPGGWDYPGIDSVAGGTLYDSTRRIVDVVYEQPEDHDGSIVRHLLVPEADANGRHIARWDPARVLAECEAKRAVVESWQRLESEDYGEFVVGGGWDEGVGYAGDALMGVLRHLAAVYSDHPSYRAEWRP